MDPAAARPLNAGIEVARDAEIVRMAMNGDAAAANLPNQRLRIADGRAVVQHLDLHLLDAGSWHNTLCSVSRK